LLSNDPHLGSLAPPAFYVFELGLLDEKNNVKIQTFGASMSGVPGVSIGINKYNAWGSTASYVDNKDLFY
jgi:acyl-homoserine lactone acylase PvdQ